MTIIRVLKLDLSGTVTWRYEGRLVRRAPSSLMLEAFFDKPDFRLLDVLWKKGDRMIESYYSDRGYNILELYDRDNGRFKGWYCNLSRPARIEPQSVSWVDLALDLWVWPDGRRALLDEEEFRALPLSEAERGKVRASARQLEHYFENKRPPS